MENKDLNQKFIDFIKKDDRDVEKELLPLIQEYLRNIVKDNDFEKADNFVTLDRIDINADYAISYQYLNHNEYGRLIIFNLYNMPILTISKELCSVERFNDYINNIGIDETAWFMLNGFKLIKY